MDTVLLFGYMTPLFLMLVIPIACMLSVFLTFLRMSTDRELVALRAGGINIYQMLPAPLLFSVICMLLTLWVSLHWLAWGMGHFRETIDPLYKVVFYTLRHTFASWLVMQGVPLYNVGKMLGHKTTIMTQRYAHLSPDYMHSIDKLPDFDIKI